MSYEITRLNQVFENFSNFGSGSQLGLNDETKMDNFKFAKFCRETKIIDKKFSSTDADIIFKKILKKGERKINFDQFKSALRLLAQEKYQNDDKAFNRLLELVRQAEPGTTGTTTAKTSGIYSKLTDPSLYTGSHKERFDETGKGKGLAGRDTVAKTDDLSKIVARSNRPSKRGVSNSMEDMNRQQSRPAIQPNSKSAYSSKKSLASQQSAVFDRLTDHTKYTGSHKHRFDQDSGKGRGISGRDVGANGSGTVNTYRGGAVHSIAQILRK